MQIVCYTGGTCGDIVTASIDPTGIELLNNRVVVPADRGALKKPHLFANTEQKDQYIVDIATKYQSIPSHDLEYHSQCGHDFIGIAVETKSVATWAAQRFKDLHRPHVWEEMSKFCNATTVDDYAQILLDFSNLIKTKTSKIIYLEKILDGLLPQQLNDLGVPYHADLYQQWLTKNRKTNI